MIYLCCWVDRLHNSWLVDLVVPNRVRGLLLVSFCRVGWQLSGRWCRMDRSNLWLGLILEWVIVVNYAPSIGRLLGSPLN